MRGLRALLLAAFAIGTTATSASAQIDYPNKPIQVVIGLAAGTGADIICRYYTTRLSALTGHPIVVQNRVGAVSTIAAGTVAKARPDGYTVLFTGNGPLVAGRHLVKDVPYDPKRDFVPAASMFETSFMLSVGRESKVTTVAELIAHLKSRAENRYGYGNPTAYAAAAYFLILTGTTADAIGYRQTADALSELENTTLDFMIVDGTFLSGQGPNGKVRPLAATTARRVNALPTVPTMQEAGVSGYYFTPWWGAYFPAETPPLIVDRFGTWLTEIASAPETAQFLDNVAALPVIETPAAMTARLEKDTETWDRLAKAINMQPQ
jgi:tripartite-type tricarboxylate transporter receptor subunit TctC